MEYDHHEYIEIKKLADELYPPGLNDKKFY